MLLLFFQIFTKVDTVHAAQVLNRLGLEDGFEGIMCFETLNPYHLEPIDCMMASDDQMVIIERTPEAKAKSSILYKPSFEAIAVVIFIANFDP
ncbi:hypothetical protein ACE6H2_009375 [Prunus campanulata]